MQYRYGTHLCTSAPPLWSLSHSSWTLTHLHMLFAPLQSRNWCAIDKVGAYSVTKVVHTMPQCRHCCCCCCCCEASLIMTCTLICCFWHLNSLFPFHCLDVVLCLSAIVRICSPMPTQITPHGHFTLHFPTFSPIFDTPTIQPHKNPTHPSN